VAVSAATARPAPPSAAPSATSNALLSGAQQTVRTYINALIAGDEGTAQNQLLANAGSPNANLTEKSFLDHGSRITDISATATSPTTANVDVYIHSGSGSYYAHFEVRRLDSGVTLINEHNFAKS
jgi:hypothetical protein